MNPRARLPEANMDIPGYKIEKLIAEGGMADVYLAIQESLDRRVALKLLKRFDKPEQADRFINEGRIIASLYHRNIITIHDIGVVNDKHYISMEYLERGDLETRIGHGITPDAAVELVATIGNCLELVHSKGIVHRDIKPANILFRKDDTPVLTDFGIAKQLNQNTKLTMDGTAMGSPDYLSPEQAACKPLDGRADIYSLGILFYEMLTGEKPYRGESYIEIVMAHIGAPIPSLPEELKRYQPLLEKMIAKDPEKRFASVTEMIAYIDKHFRKKSGKGIWAWISGLFRKAAAPKIPIVASLEKTLEFPAVQDTAGDPRPTARKPHSRWPRVIYRSFLLTGVILVVIGGSVSIVDHSSEEVLAPQTSARPVVPGSVVVDPPVAAAAHTEVPEPLFIPPKTHKPVENKKMVQYLSKARAALDAYKLTLPENDNAYFYYKKVLALEPKNKVAKQGMIEIADRYANLAEREIERYDYARAEQYVQAGLRVNPGHKRLLALDKRTNALKDIPTRLFKKIESVFE